MKKISQMVGKLAIIFEKISKVEILLSIEAELCTDTVRVRPLPSLLYVR